LCDIFDKFLDTSGKMVKKLFPIRAPSGDRQNSQKSQTFPR
jgi:hypothetical protein